MEKCPSSIWHWYPNPRPSGRESPPITTTAPAQLSICSIRTGLFQSSECSLIVIQILRDIGNVQRRYHYFCSSSKCCGAGSTLICSGIKEVDFGHFGSWSKVDRYIPNYENIKNRTVTMTLKSVWIFHCYRYLKNIRIITIKILVDNFKKMKSDPEPFLFNRLQLKSTGSATLLPA